MLLARNGKNKLFSIKTPSLQALMNFSTNTPSIIIPEPVLVEATPVEPTDVAIDLEKRDKLEAIM